MSYLCTLWPQSFSVPHLAVQASPVGAYFPACKTSTFDKGWQYATQRGLRFDYLLRGGVGFYNPRVYRRFEVDRPADPAELAVALLSKGVGLRGKDDPRTRSAFDNSLVGIIRTALVSTWSRGVKDAKRELKSMIKMRAKLKSRTEPCRDGVWSSWTGQRLCSF